MQFVIPAHRPLSADSVTNLRLTRPQRQQRPYIRHVLHAFQQGDEVQQVVVSGVVDPAFDGNGIVCSVVVNFDRMGHA